MYWRSYWVVTALWHPVPIAEERKWRQTWRRVESEDETKSLVEICKRDPRVRRYTVSKERELSEPPPVKCVECGDRYSPLPGHESVTWERCPDPECDWHQLYHCETRSCMRVYAIPDECAHAAEFNDQRIRGKPRYG